MNDLLGISYWLYFLMHNNAPDTIIDTYIQNIEKNPHDYTAILDLSILFELLGQSESAAQLRDRALKYQTLFLLQDKKSYRQPLRFSRMLYDKRTLQPLGSSMRLLIIKTANELAFNSSVEVFIDDTTLDIQYISNEMIQPDDLWNGLLIGVAPIEENIKILQSIYYLDSYPEIFILNSPKNLLHLIDVRRNRQFKNVENASWQIIDAEPEHLKETDGFYYQYRIILVKGIPYVYSVSVAKNFINLASEEEMYKEPVLFEREKEKLAQFAIFGTKYQNVFNSIWKELNLEFMVINCLENSDHLYVQDINTNQLLTIDTDDFRTYRSDAISLISDAVTELVYYAGVRE